MSHRTTVRIKYYTNSIQPCYLAHTLVNAKRCYSFCYYKCGLRILQRGIIHWPLLWAKVRLEGSQVRYQHSLFRLKAGQELASKSAIKNQMSFFFFKAYQAHSYFRLPDVYTGEYLFHNSCTPLHLAPSEESEWNSTSVPLSHPGTNPGEKVPKWHSDV